MFSVIASVLILVLAITIVRSIVAVPLIRTLAAALNGWADSVQDEPTDRTR